MATIDDKVVAMSFESSKFESGVSSTLNALNKLKTALNFPNAGKGLQDLDSAANKVDLSPVGRAIDSLKSKFSTMRIVALSVLSNIATKAVTAGLSFVKSLTLDPIIAGFHNYETQINAVQTILANTGLKGKQGLQQVNDVLAQLNTYANKTVYNFSEMTRNIGTFTAAGVGLKTSAESIKGIANLAALSGSNSDQASSAMYQLSQAIAANQVKLQDWNSVVNAGLGGKVFQEALFNTGKALGTIKNVPMNETFKQWTNAGNSFRLSLQNGWITGKVLTQTLQGFTGDLTAAQLKSMGYTQAQAKQILTMGKTAQGAATNIKTLTQLTQALKEEVATAWGAIFKTIFGNIHQATSLFSGIHTVAENALTKPIYSLNKLLEGWAKLGGRTILIDALKNAFKDLGAIMTPIHDAFREIFPPTTAQHLLAITKSFDAFTKAMKPSQSTLDNLKRTFAGLFAIFDIGKQLVSGIFTVFAQLFKEVGKGGGGFLNLTGSIGDFFVSVDKALKSGNRLHDFFVGLGQILAKPIQFLEKMASAIGHLFSGFGSQSSGGFSAAIVGITGAFGPFQKVLTGAHLAWSHFIGSFSSAGQQLAPAFNAIVNEFGNLGNQIGQAIQNINFSGLLEIVRTGLLGGMFLIFKKFFSGGGLGKLLGGGILKNAGEAFDALTGSLHAMQQNIQAKTLQEIAIAIGILTASIVALSFVNAKQLNRSMSAIAIAMAELLGAMKVLTKIGEGAGFLKIPIIAGSMILLSTAVDVLVIAVSKLSGLNWAELAKGLGGVGVLLGGIALAAKPLSESSKGLIAAGLGITAISIAMNILALAVKQFGGMSMSELAKGLASVAISLGSIGLASKLFPPGMVAIGAGLAIVAGALKILAGAVHDFGKQSLGVIAKGIAAIAAALVVIAGAMHLMPPGMIVMAAGLTLVGVALKGITKAVESLGGQSLGTLAKGIVSLAGALTVLSVALIAMSGTFPGAAALTVASAGLALLAPAMVKLGSQSWSDILKSMVALGGAMVVLGAAGLLLAPVSPALLALGAAMLAIGGGLALAGAGIALVAAGLSAIAITGPAGIGILLKAVSEFVAAIPGYATSFVHAFLNIVTGIANAAPQFVDALGKILVSLSEAIVKAAPALVKAFDALMKSLLQVIHDNFPAIVQSGFEMLMTFLKGIKSHISEVTKQVAEIIVTFLTALSNRFPQIVAAGFQILIKFIDGIANNLGKVVNAGGNLIVSLINGISNNIGKVINAGGNLIVHLVSGIANNISKVVDAGANAIIKLVNGITSKVADVIKAGFNAMGNFITGISQGAVQLVDKGAQAVVTFLNGIAAAIKRYLPQIIAAGVHIGEAICQGIISGIANLAGNVIGSVGNLIGSLPSKALHILGISSPSKVFMDIGENLVMGLVVGIDSHADKAVGSVEKMTNALVETMNTIPDVLSNVTDLNPVITPILDLTGIQEGADKMSQIITNPVVDTSTSFGQASAISLAQANAQTALDKATTQPAPSVTFEQNNYSPKSLSEVDIYRQTRNQLSQLKRSIAFG